MGKTGGKPWVLNERSHTRFRGAPGRDSRVPGGTAVSRCADLGLGGAPVRTVRSRGTCIGANTSPELDIEPHHLKFPKYTAIAGRGAHAAWTYVHGTRGDGGAA